jgi:hypothetical protein
MHAHTAAGPGETLQYYLKTQLSHVDSLNGKRVQPVRRACHIVSSLKILIVLTGR